jgi:hypothetical protein
VERGHPLALFKSVERPRGPALPGGATTRQFLAISVPGRRPAGVSRLQRGREGRRQQVKKRRRTGKCRPERAGFGGVAAAGAAAGLVGLGPTARRPLDGAGWTGTATPGQSMPRHGGGVWASLLLVVLATEKQRGPAHRLEADNGAAQRHPDGDTE